MLDILTTLFFQHDLTLVSLAAVVCLVSAFAGMTLMHRARAASGRRRIFWLCVSAVAVGVGVWSTHFIAMLAYWPGFSVGYQPAGTIASLAIAIMMIGIGFALAIYGSRRSDHILGGCVVGIGIATMHYSGMAALRLGGDVLWDTGLVVLSVAFSAGLGAAAVMTGAVGTTIKSQTIASTTLTLAIVLLHFTGMGAIDLSKCYAIIADNQLQVGWMAAAVAVGSAIILGSAMAALILDSRDARRGELESLRLHSLADAAVESLVIVSDNTISGVNASFARLVGTGLSCMTGASLEDLLVPADLQKARGNVDTMVETTLTLPDGEKVAIELVSRKADLGDGRTEVLAIRDIRKRLAREAEALAAVIAAKESEDRFGWLVQSVTDYAIYQLSPEGLVVTWNAGAQRNKGYIAQEIIGRSFSTFFSAEDRAAGLPQRSLDAAKRDGKFATEGWRYRKDGSRFWAQVSIEAVRKREVLEGFIKITKDITRQHEDAERIAIATRNLEVSLDSMSQGLALFGEDERIVTANRRFKEILGVPVHLSVDGLGLHDLAKFLLGEETADVEAIDNAYILHKRLIAGEDDGEIVQEFVSGRAIRIVHRPAGGKAWVSTFEDISERRKSEQQILFMAHHDGLTGLPNRGSFVSHLHSALEQAGKGSRVAVLGIDLDRFKEINDQFGHQTGDIVLKRYAGRVSGGLQEDEFIARFGGDEFAAYKIYQDDAALDDFLDRLLSAVADRFEFDDKDVSIGASIGVAIYPEDAHTPEKLISNADMAMYRAKDNLTEHICFYEPDMDEAARDRRLMAHDLWDAAGKGELTLRYQIQKSVRTGSTTGYEALLRWQHPVRGLVSPVDFIPVAEECGAILQIGEWVLMQACMEAAIWEDNIKLAVNISPVQLGSLQLVDVVRNALATSGLPAERLELEVTESAIIADKARALHTLRQVKDLGVTIAIDDFGTGYSSLETLRAFPFDKIKLDRSFMSEVETSKQSKAMVRAILALGRGLDVPVLAEGVETLEQLDFLLLEGCDEAQGYLLGRPEILGRDAMRNTG